MAIAMSARTLLSVLTLSLISLSHAQPRLLDGPPVVPPFEGSPLPSFTPGGDDSVSSRTPFPTPPPFPSGFNSTAPSPTPSGTAVPPTPTMSELPTPSSTFSFPTSPIPCPSPTSTVSFIDDGPSGTPFGEVRFAAHPRNPSDLSTTQRQNIATVPNAVACTNVYRELNGVCTNSLFFLQGAFKRAQFAYGIPRSGRTPTTGLPSARLVSNIISSQFGDIFSRRCLSEITTFMGQFLDHSLIETPAMRSEVFDIPIPRLDPVFANFTGGVLTFRRSRRTLDVAGRERPINELPSAIDLFSVYGSEEDRLDKLRTKTGGLLLVSAGNLLPLNTFDLMNAPSKSSRFFVAGDIRVNENPVLTALHTLFMREHNRLARDLQRTFPFWTDEKLFQSAKLLNSAQYQKIIFDEFYPAMTGRRLRRYRGFNPAVDPTVSDVFGAMAFRVGHTMVGNQINRRWIGNAPLPPIPFTEMFFRENSILNNGIEPFLRGAIFEPSQEVDVFVVQALRNFLFTNVPQPDVSGLDLMALNLQRARDHALPLYNELRVLFGRRPVRAFWQITHNRALQGALHSAYGSVDRVEGIIGIFAEDHVRGASMGRTMLRMWEKEFTRLRDGDRFFFRRLEAYPAELWRYPGLRSMLRERNTFKKVILRNTIIAESEILGSVWRANRAACKYYEPYKSKRNRRKRKKSKW